MFHVGSVMILHSSPFTYMLVHMCHYLNYSLTLQGRSSSVVPKQEGKTDSDAVPQTPEAEAAQLPTGDKLLPQRLDANMKTAISTMQKFASAREARHQRTRAAVGDHVIKTRIRVLENSIQCPVRPLAFQHGRAMCYVAWCIHHSTLQYQQRRHLNILDAAE